MNKLRTIEIVDYVKQRKYCSSKDLAKAFGVSPATIQRDITEIVEKNYLRKVHGGIASFEVTGASNASAIVRHFTERVAVNPEKKSHIARLAEQVIESGDIIFLDSSTTALYLARLLQKSTLSNLTIVTNSVLIIQEFHLFPPHFVLVSIGGSFNFQLNSFLGRTAVENLRQLRLTKAFYSAVGINKDGIYTYHESHVEFLKLMLELTQTAYVLIDSTKFNKTAIFPITPTADIPHLITDAEPPQDISRLIADIQWETQAPVMSGR